MGATIPICIVKVGGSLLADAPRLRAVLQALADGKEGRVTIVPGGGPFADAVRASQAALGYSDALAHRLALDAMGRMAEVMAEIEPRLAIVSSVDAAVEHGDPCLWDPVALRAGHPDIPESWDVTSDSLALWLAKALGAARCVLLKSAPCPTGASPGELARLGVVDRAFPDFARAFGGEIVLRGPDTPFRPHPHLELPQRSEGFEGGLRKTQSHLEPSFEARLRLPPHDEDVGGMTRVAARNAAA